LKTIFYFAHLATNNGNVLKDQSNKYIVKKTSLTWLSSTVVRAMDWSVGA
jgi:hypothetical protein